MCEMSSGTYVKNREQADKPSDDPAAEQETYGSAPAKFDIGEFVHTQRKLRLLLKPSLSIVQSVSSILRWKSPRLSLLACVICCFVAVRCPVYFLIAPIAYISVLLAASGVYRKGLSNTPERRLRNKRIRKKEEETDTNIKLEVERQAKEDLQECIRLLVEIQELSGQLCQFLENLYRIFRWENGTKTLQTLACCIVLMIVLQFLPRRFVMLLCVLASFGFNSGFKEVFRNCIRIVTQEVEKFHQHLTRQSSRQGLKKRSFTSSTDLDEEWFDANSSDDAAGEDKEDEDDMDEDLNQPHQIQKSTEHKSVVSRLVDYREKQKKLNSGNCSSCNAPFTSILKKRQYCRHCGMGFCSRCCSHRVKRAVFGATAPAAYEETVLVCKSCYDFLMRTNSEDKPDEL